MDSNTLTPTAPRKKFNLHVKSLLGYFLIFSFGCIVGLAFLSYSQSLKTLKPVVKEQKNEAVTEQKVPLTVEDSDVKEVTDAVLWNLPISNKQGFPLLVTTEKSHLLKIYSINDSILLDTKIDYKWSSGATGFGDTDPTVSPNFYYTAYIGNDKKLYILNHETLKSFEVPNSSQVEYITGWMKDNNRIIYYLPRLDDLENVTQGMGGTPEVYKYAKTSRIGGFYIFNILTGVNTSLYPVTNIEAIVSNNTILCKDTTTSDRMVSFNVDTFVADFSSIKDKFGYGVDNFDVSNDSKYWTFLFSKNRDTSGNSVVVAPYPKLEGTTIVSGGWADFQKPKISPDGLKIAYVHKNGEVRTGIPRYFLNIYDTKSKQITEYTEARHVEWLSNNLLVLDLQYEAEDGRWTSKYNLLNLNTGIVKQLTDK